MSQIQDDADMVLKSVAKQVVDKLAEPTRTWRHQVVFRVVGPFTRGNDRVIQAFTTDDPYFWLDNGAIRKVRMSRSFRPKTRPKSFVAGSGAPPFDPLYKSKNVLGKTEARRWTELAAAEKQMILQQSIDRVLARYNVGQTTTGAKRTPQFTP